MRITRIVALALVVGTLFTAQAVLTQVHTGRLADVAPTVFAAMLFWGLWAFLTPVVLLAVRRWSLDTTPIYRPILVHITISIVMAVVQTVLALGVRSFALYVSGSLGSHAALKAIASPAALAWGAFTGVFFYWLVAAADSAVRFRDRYAALEPELNRSKLDALRSQLRPHFLFNTLNAISALVPQGDKAHRMLLRLSSLLRRSLDEDSHEVPLQTELAFLNDYLDIQRVRFGEQLVVDVDTEPGALGACSGHYAIDDDSPRRFQSLHVRRRSWRDGDGILPEQRDQHCRFFTECAMQMQRTAEDNVFGDLAGGTTTGQCPLSQLCFRERRHGTFERLLITEPRIEHTRFCYCCPDHCTTLSQCSQLPFAIAPGR